MLSTVSALHRILNICQSVKRAEVFQNGHFVYKTHPWKTMGRLSFSITGYPKEEGWRKLHPDCSCVMGLSAMQLKDLKGETKASGTATEMALIHNVIIRGINSIYLQAPNIKLENDIEDFLTYMYSWSLLVHIHHDNEEATMFPLLEKYIGVDNYSQYSRCTSQTCISTPETLRRGRLTPRSLF